jgi:hypothetical protein
MSPRASYGVDGKVTTKRANDAGLAQRRVDDPLVAEPFVHVFGDAKYATFQADVFTESDQRLVTLEGVVQRHIDCLGQVNACCLTSRFRLGSNLPDLRSRDFGAGLAQVVLFAMKLGEELFGHAFEEMTR